MSVGIIAPRPAYTLDPAFIAKKAEDLGFESIWYHEHPVLPVKSESAFPASRTERFLGPTPISPSLTSRWRWPRR